MTSLSKTLVFSIKLHIPAVLSAEYVGKTVGALLAQARAFLPVGVSIAHVEFSSYRGKHDANAIQIPESALEKTVRLIPAPATIVAK